MGESEKAFLWVKFMAAALSSIDPLSKGALDMGPETITRLAAGLADNAVSEFQYRFPKTTSIREN